MTATEGSQRIVVTRPLPERALALLRDHGSVSVPDEDRALRVDELRRAVAGAAAVVTMLHDRVDDELLDAAGDDLQVVANVAVGYENVDVAACAHRGVVVTNTPGVLVDATADHTMALMLAVTRRVAEGDRLLRSGVRWSWALTFMLGTELRGLRLGIVGFGQIGQAVARRAAAFGLTIAYTSPREADARVPADRLALDDLLRTSDLVSLHCPLTPDTHHLVDARALSMMKPSAYLINTSRGPVVDESALADALARGRLAGAGLDVFEREPEIHPGLLGLDNVVLTPHLGSATVETREAMALLAARNVVEVLAGRPPLSPVVPRRC